MDKKKYRSYSKTIVAAVNEHFERQKRLADDPYLETRENEDAFLKRITETMFVQKYQTGAFLQPKLFSKNM